MLGLLALAWLYLVGLLVIWKLQDHTTAFQDYGVASTWALLLIWPVSAPVSFVLYRFGRKL